MGSTKLSGLGSGHVLDRALVCGSNCSCRSVIMSIWSASVERPSRPLGGDGHGELNESIFEMGGGGVLRKIGREKVFLTVNIECIFVLLHFLGLKMLCFMFTLCS